MSRICKTGALVAVACLLATVGDGSAQSDCRREREAPTQASKIDAAKNAALNAKAGLTGYQARVIDSIVGVIDSFQRMNRLFNADKIGQELTALIPILKEDEAKAAHLKKLVPGEWVFSEKQKSAEYPQVNAVATKIFRFEPDGKLFLVEKKNGQSSPYLKEDWHFESWGTYGCKGDTIMLIISRFAAVKQQFSRLHNVDGKDVWKDEYASVFDSVITDGSQDRYITYEDLKTDFKKVR
jgi:hypothetical protein